MARDLCSQQRSASEKSARLEAACTAAPPELPFALMPSRCVAGAQMMRIQEVSYAAIARWLWQVSI
jgi:hypothetical protein